jgi:lipopolysaccharide/colanic/teichoic acid biosynthesis glycosyltransferase
LPREYKRRPGKIMIRVIDVFLSGLAILLLLPFMLPIMFLLKLTGEHDIFYRQERIGKDGKPFKVLKFATMLRDSPNLHGGLITLKDDPRLLPLGGFLRKTKINELPQLINIFLGDMSVIGYRPFAKVHYNLYSDEVKKAIGKIRPGLSGIGSIIFKSEEDILQGVEDRDRIHDKVITPYKGLLESWYVEHNNLATYFILIFLTIRAFIRPNNKVVWRIFKDLPPIPEELKDYL